MPSDAFSKLSDEKKERILQAAISEFSEFPLMKATSTNVIRKSGISRGSFYQYFENIQSVYHYTINQLWKKYRLDLIHCLEEADKDLYAGLLAFAKYYLNDLQENGYINIIKNLVAHMNYLLNADQDTQSLAHHLFRLFETGVDPEANDIFSVIDLSRYRFSNKDEAIDFIHYVIGLLHEVIIFGYLKGLTPAQIMTSYRQHLDWLFKGIEI